MGVNKLHLGVGQTLMPINVTFVADEHARHDKSLCAIQPGGIRGHEVTGARLLRCAFFHDSHGYADLYTSDFDIVLHVLVLNT